MENTYTSTMGLPLNFEGEADIEAEIYGIITEDHSDKDNEKDTDTLLENPFLDALNRYIGVRNIGNNQLAALTGIDKGVISRYLNGERKINKEHLCLICIALRLMTCQQKHLFDLAKEPMPCSIGKPDKSELLVKHCMDGCYYNTDYTVARLIEMLNNAELPKPTVLTDTNTDGE